MCEFHIDKIVRLEETVADLRAHLAAVTKERDAVVKTVNALDIAIRNHILTEGDLRKRVEELERERDKLLGQRNGWAEKRHAQWCCTRTGGDCCCGHDEAQPNFPRKEGG
jgi:chromosome segregation ATPase